MKALIKKYPLKFKFDAGTSRGVLREKTSCFIAIFDERDPSCFGLGECGPLPGLSPDLNNDLDTEIQRVCSRFELLREIISDDVNSLLRNLVKEDYPALRFAVETALMDYINDGQRLFYKNKFSSGEQGIPINGLVWMGNKDFMLSQVREKIEHGFDCIKIKVGAIDLESELQVLKSIRSKYSKDQISIRLDANGAFNAHTVAQALGQMAVYDIHSIEQPVPAGHWDLMANVCRNSPIPVALDEELIGINSLNEKNEVLRYLRPSYIILKPTLLGGMSACNDWIRLANGMGIGWWVTSALESNIGLNAIAQYTAQLSVNIHQGLGTGMLYHNNIPSPLTIRNGKLWYSKETKWDYSALEF